MITFKHKANSKRINIRTSKKLDDRMSAWLQKVFNIRNQIIGFKSSESTYSLMKIHITMSKPFIFSSKSFIIHRYKSFKEVIRSKSHVSLS